MATLPPTVHDAPVAGPDLPPPVRALDLPVAGDLAAEPSRRGTGTDRPHAPAPTALPRPADQTWRVPASARQQSFWDREAMPGGRSGTNLVECLQLTTPVDRDLLERVGHSLMERHSALRTSFELTVDGLEQVVLPATTVRMSVSELGIAAGTEPALALADAFGAVPFDLAAAPLLRLGRVQGDAGDLVVVVVHHAVADAWSLDLLLEELVALLATGGDAPATRLPDLALQYVDVVEWEVSRSIDDRQAAIDDGLSRLQDAAKTGAQLLPHDRPSGPVADVSAGLVTGLIPSETVARIEALARSLHVTTHQVLCASLGVVLGRSAGEDLVVLGSTLSGRGEPELDRVIGCCINTGLLRVDLGGGAAFATVVRRVADDAAAAAAHQWLPLELPLRLLDEASREAAVPVLLNLINLPANRPDPAGLTATRHSRPSAMAYADIDLCVEPAVDGLRISAAFATPRMDSGTVATLLVRWLRLVEDALDDPAAPVGSLALLTVGEEQRTAALEGTDGPFEPGSVLARFERHLQVSPDSPALVDADGPWTREELSRRADDIAGLLGRHGVTTGDHVVLALDGTGDVVASLLACWRLAAVAVPVGQSQPAARLDAVRQACDARVLVDADLLRAELVPANARPRRDAAADADLALMPAYVIFTSGSTGEPKGVVVSHGALLASTLARLEAYPDRPATALLAHDMAFDAGLGIIAWYLGTGGRLILATRDERLDPELLAQLIHQHGIGQLDVVPSHYGLLLECTDPDRLQSLRLVTLGGEACPPDLVAAHLATLPDATLVNEYGPTECTVWSVAHTADAADAKRRRVPIGRPVRGVIARVADRHGRPVPAGRDGELLLSGHLLAEGYLGRPEQTRERFVTLDERRWYRTGDRSRWTADGELEFLGRVDGQINVRGFRVETDEVAGAIAALPDVRRAVVAVREVAAGAPVLVGWAQPAAGKKLTGAQVREDVARVLPEWMVPAVVAIVDLLPETIAGKVDQAKLTTPAVPRSARGAAPAGRVQLQVAQIWADLLGRPVTDVGQSFFALGGQSLLAARMVARVRQVFDVPLALADVLLAPDVTGVALLVEAQLASSPVAHPSPTVTGPAGPPDAAQASLLLSKLDELSDEEVDELLAQLEQDQ